jgi:hypothetical protein
MVVFRAAIASLFIFMGACGVGEVPAGGGSGTPDAAGGGSGAASFTSQISPLVTRCIGCHSATQGPTLTSFDALQAKYKMKPGASNIFVTKGDATAGMHQGVAYFSAIEKTSVAGWIDSL